MEPVKPDRLREALLWGIVGFILGTVLVAPLVLSIDRTDQLIGGTIIGGGLGGTIGALLGAFRERR